MGIITMSESGEILIAEGIVYVDSSKGSITLLLPPGNGKELTIKKISNDNNVIILYFPQGTIGSGEILIFGLPAHARIQRGKAMSVTLRGTSTHWRLETSCSSSRN